jgi:hypothetical protein
MMGFTLTSRLRIGLAGILAALAVVAVAPGSVSAAAACTGSNIQGRGASLEGVAQSAWVIGFRPTMCRGMVGTVNYSSANSFVGMNAWNASGVGASNTYAFLGTSAPPTTAQKSNMELATGSGGTGSTVVNVPLIQTAIAIVANLPVNCTLTGITAANLELAFRGTSAPTWATLGGTGTGCGVSPRRIVRADQAGTTWALKGYFNRVNGAAFCTGSGPFTWAALRSVSLNVTWCNDAVNLQVSLAGGTGPAGGAGDPDEVKTVANIDNSIGYAGLPEAKNAANDPGGATTILAVRGITALATFQNPSNGSNNANCSTANGAYTNAGGGLPNPDGVWSGVEFSAPGSTYAICALTYALALENYVPLWGTGAAGVRQTVCDYLGYVTSAAGALAGRYYADLPGDVRAQTAAALPLIGC